MPDPQAVTAANKTKRLGLRLTPAEHKAIRREALERDVSVQDFVMEATRRALKQTKRREPEPVSA